MINKKLSDLFDEEKRRQQNTITLIPSENYVSKEIRSLVGSELANKYSEGYPKKKYYQGNSTIEQIEQNAIEAAKEIFSVPHANVQPYSGAIANAATYFALLQPGDTILGMSLPFGGHLTHGHPDITFSGKYFKSIHYTTDKNGYIDFGELEDLALKYQPKLIVSGASAYSRTIDFQRFSDIADKVDAWHLSDISHISGLVVGGVHPSPVEHAHIVMTTTHKTLRGPRGAILMATNKGLSKNERLGELLDKAVFPGLQGGPQMNTIAGINQCLEESKTENFKKYAQQTVKNSKHLAQCLKETGFEIVSGGTDNHLFLIDMRPKGKDAWLTSWALEMAGIVTNRNTIPFETGSAYYPSGIRVGTPAVTTRGMKEAEMEKIADWISVVVETVPNINPDDKKSRSNSKCLLEENPVVQKVKAEVANMCSLYPIP